MTDKALDFQESVDSWRTYVEELRGTIDELKLKYGMSLYFGDVPVLSQVSSPGGPPSLPLVTAP